MPVPSVTFRSELDPVVRKELDQLDGELTGWMLQEHDDDGKHGKITADAITVDGPVAITGGPLTLDGVPVTVGGPVLPHHVTHEPGGSDALVNAAWVHQANTFQTHQTVQGNFAATGSIASDITVYGAQFQEPPRTVPMGYWIAVPFNAAHYAGTGGMNWTVSAGHLTANHYTLIGKTLYWNVLIAGGLLSGTSAAAITLTIPPPFTAAQQTQINGQLFLSGVGWVPALISGGSTSVTIYRLDTAPMALGTVYVSFQLMVPIL
jgi:hypothetical protein